jgi:hypothetical protein
VPLDGRGPRRHCPLLNFVDPFPMATKTPALPRPKLADSTGKPTRSAQREWVGAQFCANVPVRIIDDKHADYLGGGLVVSAIPKPGSNPPVVAVRVDKTGDIIVVDATQIEALA